MSIHLCYAIINGKFLLEAGDLMANLKDVAARAGVSLSTVSIIVNNKAEERKISSATQEKVKRAIDELGYKPNIVAKKLKMGIEQKITIALFWTFDFRRSMLTRFFTGLQEQTIRKDFACSIILYPYISGALKNELPSFVGGHFHAAIIANALPEDISFLESQNLTVPVVLYNRLSDQFSSVNLDDRKIGRVAAQHMYKMGYRQPIIVGAKSLFTGAAKRRSAFIHEMQSLDVPITHGNVFFTDNSVTGGFDFASGKIESLRHKQADSFFCDSDAIALGLTRALISHGVSVPDNCGVVAVGSGDPQFAEFSTPSLTVIDIPMHYMAAACCDILKEKMSHSNTPKKAMHFDAPLIIRESSKPKLGAEFGIQSTE